MIGLLVLLVVLVLVCPTLIGMLARGALWTTLGILALVLSTVITGILSSTS